MILLLVEPHLSFLADRLGLSIRTYRHVHHSASLMLFALALFHILVVVGSKASFPLNLPENLSGLIVCLHIPPTLLKLTLRKAESSLSLVLLLSYSLFRKPSYELFLRLHQALSVVFLTTTWRHLPSDKLSPRVYVYISVAVFLGTSILEFGSVLHQNGIFYYSFPQAYITLAGSAIRVQVHLRKPLKIRAGQYINL